MAIVHPIITLNVNVLNAQIKRHRVDEWIKQDPIICYLQETHFGFKNIYKLKVKGWKKMLHANVNQKRGGVAISDKTDWKSKSETTNKDHYIMIKGSSHQEYIITENIYAPNIGATKYVKQLTDLKRVINSNIK